MNTTDQPTPEPRCLHCDQLKSEHLPVTLRCLVGNDEYFEPKGDEPNGNEETKTETLEKPTDVAPEPGWRMLDVGEVIQEGDEMDEPEGWKPCQSSVGIPLLKGYSVRRRLPSQPETPSGPHDALPPKDEAQGETPRTDANAIESRQYVGNGADFVSLAFARQLERELAAAQRALAAAEGERVESHREALRLATVIWRSEYQTEAPQWKPLDTTAGIISQIDNMFAGIRQQRDAALTELQALKAQPLPVPQTPQEHIEDVMKSSFGRGCG